MLSMHTMARFSSDSVAIRCVGLLPVLWIPTVEKSLN